MTNITLSHGSGGKLTYDLISNFFLKHFSNKILLELNDSALINFPKGKFAFTTDSYVVNPIFFPGGDIGKLAVCGTINDLAVMGAIPLYLSCAFIIEENLPFKDLEQIIVSMKKTAQQAEVEIVTGDTKVVEKGKGDKIFITTSGIGIIDKNLEIKPSKIRVGDKIILSGSIGEHGVCILKEQKKLDFQGKRKIKSDCNFLTDLIQEMLKVKSAVHCLRDPTRGGLATTLNEIVLQINLNITIEEEKIPIRKETKAICEILGIDPLYLANEGKLIAFVNPSYAKEILAIMKQHKLGKEASIIGEVKEKTKKTVVLNTIIGGTRIIDMMVGEQLPRIC